MGILVYTFYSSTIVLFCVGCFKDATVTLLKSNIVAFLWDKYVLLDIVRIRENREEKGTFILTFGDRHCEITAMAFQLSQITFRNEMTNCNRELQFPHLIIYFS